ncbi:MAG: FAD-dependent monooxygenase [Myxococcota bacterium]
MNAVKTVDIAIIGGGLGGNLLARQLRREVPEVSVALFERSRERSYKVGESTVEIAAHYLVGLGLSTYLYKEHLPKNGLRFFFDSEDRALELPEMSEIGVNSLPPYPSFQLDRARLERDLLEMNKSAGVDVRIGALVQNLALERDGAAHTFSVREDESESCWEARWVIDATGRESTIAKQLDLRVPEKNHRIAAAWGRFQDVVDMDDLPAPEWRARAKHTSRVLSTNHFCYHGYWIWFIPLREGLTSVGVVQESKDWNVARHKPEGFLSFLREHRAIASLLPDAKLVDLDAFTQLAFRTKQFFSPDRWCLLGDSAAFTDPFYSPGSDFIANENDLITDLVRRDIAGEALAEVVDLYDRFMQYRFDTTLVVYQDLYPALGSYELFRAKAYFDTAIYYNLLFDSYADKQHTNPRWMRTTLRKRMYGLEMMSNFGRLFRAGADEMLRRGTYYRGNAGNAQLEGRTAFGVLADVGQGRHRREIAERNEAIFARTEKILREALDQDPTGVEAFLPSHQSSPDVFSSLAAG